MPISQTDQLYKLIRSLDKSEKRHFKLFVNRLDSNKNVMFIKLFDLLDKSKSFDESLIEKNFPKVKQADLINIKRHLFSQILKSLRLIHSRHDFDIQVREQLDYAKVLYSKGLHLQSLKLLERAQKIAINSSQEIMLLEIMEFQKLIESRHITRSRSIKNKVEQLIVGSRKSQVTITRTSELGNLSLMIQGLYIKMGFVKNDKESFLVNSYFNSNLPKVISKSPGFYEEVLLHQSYVWFHYMMQDYEESLNHAIKWIDVFDDNKVMQAKDPDLYIRGMHYVLTNNFYLKSKEDFDAWLKRYSKFSKEHRPNFNETTKRLNFIYGYNAKLNHLHLHNRFEKAKDLEKEIFSELKNFQLNIDSHRIKMFNFKFACFNIANGEYEDAIDHLNFIIQPNQNTLRKDLICYAKLLNLICNFHLGNAALVNNLSNGVRRAFELQQELNPTITAIIQFLNKNHRPNISIEAAEKLLKKLDKTYDHRYDKRIFNYFNFKVWAQSIIQETTVANLYIRKN